MLLDNPTQCKDCGVGETPETFYRRYGGKKFPYCRACAQRRMREWCQRNKGKRKRTVRNHTLKRLYGIDHDQYDFMLELQDGVCAVCKSPPETCVQSSLCVDHSHETGRIRGLLCDNCNRALGQLKDNPDIIARLLSYVRAHA